MKTFAYFKKSLVAILSMTLLLGTLLPNTLDAQFVFSFPSANRTYPLNKPAVDYATNGVAVISMSYYPGATISVDIRKIVSGAVAKYPVLSGALNGVDHFVFIAGGAGGHSAWLQMNDDGVVSATSPSTYDPNVSFAGANISGVSSAGAQVLYVQVDLKILDPCTPGTISTPQLTSAYIQQTTTDRKFTPPVVPVTPFDTFATDFYFPAGCADSVIRTLVPKMEAVNESGIAIQIVQGSLVKQTDEPGHWRWTLTGWPNGIATGTQLDTLIASIANKRRIDVVLKKASGTEVVRKQVDNVMSDCLQVYGAGKYGTVFMRDSTTGTLGTLPPVLLSKTQEVKNLLIGTDPFKKYSDKFSFYADFYPFRSQDILNEASIKLGRGTDQTAIYGAIDATLRAKSQCRGNTIYAAYSSLTGTFVGGQDVQGVAINKSIFAWSTIDAQLMVHEFGHAFAGLSDEYITTEKRSLPARFSASNCTTEPRRRYSFNNVLYGDPARKGCANSVMNKPTEESLMNVINISSKFNTVSCGHIIAAIKGGDPKSYYPECVTLDVEDPAVRTGRTTTDTTPTSPVVNPVDMSHTINTVSHVLTLPSAVSSEPSGGVGVSGTISTPSAPAGTTPTLASTATPFTISAAPASYQLNFVFSGVATKDFTSTVNIARGSFAGNITLSAQGIGLNPADYQVTFSSPTWSAGNSDPITATITVKNSIPSGDQIIRILGVGNAVGSPTASADVTFHVRKIFFNSF